EHCVSGMDTTFALLGLTIYIGTAVATERQPSRRRLVALGLQGGLLWWVRPDLMLYTLCVPAALFAMTRDAEVRRRALQVPGPPAATVATLVAVSWIYFQSPLPLPFYVKIGHLYEPPVYAAHRGYPAFQLRGYLLESSPLLALIATHVAMSSV